MLQKLCRPTLCAVFICLALLGCNEEREKKVIAQSLEANKTVQAEKTASDLANISQQLLASNGVALVNNENLSTTRCVTPAGVGANGEPTPAVTKVVSFIPRTATIARNGEIPGALGERMKSELEARFKPGNLIAKDHVGSLNCGIDTQLIAENSPILVLDNAFAAADEALEDTGELVDVEVAACDAGLSGIKSRKKTKNSNGVATWGDWVDGCTPTGTPTVPSIELVSTFLPNWKGQLTGDANAVSNYRCIVDSTTGACNPIEAVENTGVKIVCNDNPDQHELMVNPTYKPETAQFEADATPRDCGKGWSGELVSHIQKQVCTVTRDGVAETPATVFEVDYVGAKCKKDDLVVQTACPAGLPFSDTGRLVNGMVAAMTQPLVLEPTTLPDGTKTSRISFKRTENGQEIENTSDYTEHTLLNGTKTLIAAGGNREEPFFQAMNDLSGVVGGNFDQTFYDEMNTLQKIRPESDVTCFARDQNCLIDFPPSTIDIIVDRSTSQSSAAQVDVFPSKTTCHATMANLFDPNKRTDACQAAKAFQVLAKQKQMAQYIEPRIDDGQEPVQQYNQYLQEYIDNYVDTVTERAMNEYKVTMINALKLPMWRSRLDNGLAMGDDCNPRGNGTYSRVTEDAYGSCAPQYVGSDRDRIMQLFSNGAVLKSCQSSCPGECVTDVSRKNGQPEPTRMTRMQAVDSYVMNNLVPRMPINARVVYSEIYNGSPNYNPVVLQDSTQETTNLADINPSYYWAEATEKLVITSSQRGSPAPRGGLVLYRSIDKAIERLRAGKAGNGSDGLDGIPNVPDVNTMGAETGRYKRASLIVFGSKYDTDCIKTRTWLGNLIASVFAPGSRKSRQLDQTIKSNCKEWYESPYFGRNICEPEQTPVGYQCSYRKNWLSKRREVDIPNQDALITKYGYDGWGSRNQWCHDNGYGRSLEIHTKVTGYTETYFDWSTGRIKTRTVGTPGPTENIDSLVGFLGRNYPNVRAYYFDMDGAGLGSFCKGTSLNNYDPEEPHVFYKKKRILNIFKYTDDMNELLTSGIEQATGGGKASDEAGTLVCNMKDPNMIISYNDPVVEVPKPVQSFGTIGDGVCDPMVNIDPDLPPNMPQPPPQLPQTNPYQYGYNPSNPGNGGYNNPNNPDPNQPTIPQDDNPPVTDPVMLQLFAGTQPEAIIDYIAKGRLDVLHDEAVKQDAHQDDIDAWAIVSSSLGIADPSADLTPADYTNFGTIANAYLLDPTSLTLPDLEEVLQDIRGQATATFQNMAENNATISQEVMFYFQNLP